jgi:hypothetical protein
MELPSFSQAACPARIEESNPVVGVTASSESEGNRPNIRHSMKMQLQFSVDAPGQLGADLWHYE